jgi:hypothetical protein
MAKFNHYDKAVFDVLCAETLHKAGSFNLQAIANTLHAIAKLNHDHNAVFDVLHRNHNCYANNKADTDASAVSATHGPEVAKADVA